MHFLIVHVYLQFIDSNSTDEIPALMKGFRYPFLIKPNSLLSWTPHTWPSLLGALHWLVELCTVCLQSFVIITCMVSEPGLGTPSVFPAHRAHAVLPAPVGGWVPRGAAFQE